MRNIIFYRTQTNKCPIEDFFDNLDSKTMQKTAWTLKLIKELEFIPIKFFKKLEDTEDIWEIRIRLGSQSIRLLSFLQKNNLVVLTHGFFKKTNKTPKNEIEKAENYKNDFLRRYRNER